MRGFLLELSLHGTGTWVSVRYKRLSGLSEDVISEVYCTHISHRELDGMRNSSMGPPWGIDPTTHCTMSRCFTTELHITPDFRTCLNVDYISPTYPKNRITHTMAFVTSVIEHWIEGRKEGNVLLNNALNTFYLRLYGVRHMVKDHSDSEKGNPLLSHRLLFLISSKGLFICTIPDRIAHTTAFVTPDVEHWLEREIAQWVHHEGSIRRPIARWANALNMELHLTPG